MLVRDLTHRGLITCELTTRLGEVARLLRENHVHALVVVDGVDGKPAGVVSDLDLMVGEWLATDSDRLSTMAAMTAGELMSKPPVSIAADSDVKEAIERMRTAHLARLVVVDDGRAVGVVAISDVIAAIAEGPLRRHTVRDVMSWGIVVCRSGTPLKAVARAMIDRHSRSIVVIDGSQRPLGIVTGVDLLPVLMMEADKVEATTVDHLMHPPITIGPEATLQEAANLMIEREIHRLLVVDPAHREGMPVGIISTSDIVRSMGGADSVWR
jgi:CBS domain-containing protein